MKKGLIQRSISALRVKRKRDFRKGHAKPWEYKDYKTMEFKYFSVKIHDKDFSKHRDDHNNHHVILHIITIIQMDS
jgi:hypothetical protein